MIRPVQKILSFDRTILILSVLVILTVALTVMLSIYAGNLEKTNSALKSRVADMHSLKEELAGIKGFVESKEKKIGLAKTGGIVPALEQILASLGMKAKVIKPLDKNKVKDYIEEDAELEIQDADLNSVVNLLYKIDNAPAPFKIKNVMIRTAFDNPDRFILKMTVSLIGKG
ncbi:MAG: hypothetical protein C4526_06350 [Nitrospiraceae bacterium]|nr:MAG: hypothetical protein C4526_06350 [Nitrospiraceae bacterium]